MHLLDVQAVLDREQDIHQADPDTEVLKYGDDKTTSYAILSHRWGMEVSYKEMTKLLKMEERKRDKVRQRDGYQKIIEGCERALKDGYKWLWVDTCCIDKRSSAELSEAINSMYSWYQNSQVCYAYIGDIEESSFPSERNNSKFSKSNGWPEWFSRGWTLQELIAPKRIEFFSKDWIHIGNKRRLGSTLEKITRIPVDILEHGITSKRPSIAQIMSWAADRRTTRVEDRAYALMGLFGVSMPMLYGEGEKAFQKLQLEIMRMSSDQSIFAWDPYGRMPRYGSVLADDPSYFRDCRDIRVVESDQFVDKLADYVHSHDIGGLENGSEWRQTAHSQLMSGFVATNAGIQIWLPIIPYLDPPTEFKAILACSDNDGKLITIDLASCRSTYNRSFNATETRKTYPLTRRLYLTYSPDARETPCCLTLDDRGAACHGFTRCGTFPRDITNNTVTLSSRTNDLMVVVYANDETRSHFAVGFGYYSGQGWAHATYVKRPATQEGSWLNSDQKVYEMMWNARAQHALQSMSNNPDRNNWSPHDSFVNHAHLPQSIWAARVVWGRWDEGNLKVMVDVEQCPGCCVGPLEWTITTNDRDGLDMPGFMKTIRTSHELKLNNLPVQLDECSGQTITLGDYGECSNTNFECHGNIFGDMQAFGIDPTDLANCPVVARVSGDEDALNYPPNQDDLTVTLQKGENRLVLHQPIGRSLPNNQPLMRLLKALSTDPANKHLVTTVIHCSEFYAVDSWGQRKDSEAVAWKNQNHIEEPGLLTPLCAIASPQVWRRESACAQRREQFKSIREQFFALRDCVGTEARHQSTVR
ncbi:heterokaryon incompatibility protein-domain-containing protein [Pisolithus orientalis]|uniref:heterokaryon incompatibility protein-domain-containing protein n=1 Tax=Pisolithus orientalis TaxID=936130 RepID=UPI0022247D09|nr:heterokaryon incompatibility protein-domain-containing protein [Pisolithus orientalis]KAI5983268.1 heterokaryon incompatibility protein-domain-containing protein [Pisolithus orientalis]